MYFSVIVILFSKWTLQKLHCHVETFLELTVHLEAQDQDQRCEAKLTVVLRPGSIQNSIDEAKG